MQKVRTELEEMVLLEMHNKGFGSINDTELALYSIVGEKFFRKVIACAFKYACLEAEFLGVEKKGEFFRERCKIARINEVSDVLDKVKKYSYAWSPKDYVIKSKKSMMDRIKEKYKQVNVNCEN